MFAFTQYNAKLLDATAYMYMEKNFTLKAVKQPGASTESGKWMYESKQEHVLCNKYIYLYLISNLPYLITTIIQMARCWGGNYNCKISPHE